MVACCLTIRITHQEAEMYALDLNVLWMSAEVRDINDAEHHCFWTESFWIIEQSICFWFFNTWSGGQMGAGRHSGDTSENLKLDRHARLTCIYHGPLCPPATRNKVHQEHRSTSLCLFQGQMKNTFHSWRNGYMVGFKFSFEVCRPVRLKLGAPQDCDTNNSRLSCHLFAKVWQFLNAFSNANNKPEYLDFTQASARWGLMSLLNNIYPNTIATTGTHWFLVYGAISCLNFYLFIYRFVLDWFLSGYEMAEVSRFLSNLCMQLK